MSTQPTWTEVADACGAERDAKGAVVAFGDVVAEARAARQGAALFDLSDRGRIAVTGESARKLIHGQVTNDVLALDPGAGCYAAHLTPKGRMICDMVIRCDASDRCVIEVERHVVPDLLGRFARFAALEDCEVADESGIEVVLLLAGPGATSLLEDLLGEDVVLEVPPYHHVAATLGGHLVRVVSRADVGEQGFALHTAAERAGTLASSLVGAGARLAGRRAWEILTIECGTPLWGRDMSESNLPPECGIPHAISYTKGCYVGQETVARIHTYGQVNKELRGIASDTPVPVGAELVTREDKEVGAVTASGISPNLNRPVALGYVHRSCTDPGSRLLARTPAAAIEVEVVPLPFVERRFWPATPD